MPPRSSSVGCLAVLLSLAAAPAHANLPRGDQVESDPAPTWGWEVLFQDGFDGAAGTPPDNWHAMPGWNNALQNGYGQLDVGGLAQVRSTPGWLLPAGTTVRVTASLVMPDTGSNYAAFWVQHPDPLDPREIDVIESYGPLKPTGAQVASHLCYDETLDNGVDECGAAGLVPELQGVSDHFPDGAKPWDAYWQYDAEFTVGGDHVSFAVRDGAGNQAYSLDTTPDPRRVPGNLLPFHLRLSNKDVDPEYALPGGTRPAMTVDWVRVEVRYPPDPRPTSPVVE
ncbi:hypothetical protein L2K70_13740 [Nocardioides KLBMP 9356]|uniref:GH16 domain-containing protein n=1 Tax=Nocardioides potassii TaxID=2911371 RepID=A0ABS9HBU9_9ACTN|nr:hypothetical protein [Nocardioides potassii]MCF6378670.1 hypothetical protein [Nocardioides potassii]